MAQSRGTMEDNTVGFIDPSIAPAVAVLCTRGSLPKKLDECTTGFCGRFSLIDCSLFGRQQLLLYHVRPGICDTLWLVVWCRIRRGRGTLCIAGLPLPSPRFAALATVNCFVAVVAAAGGSICLIIFYCFANGGAGFFSDCLVAVIYLQSRKVCCP